jgi:hypothetical protein
MIWSVHLQTEPRASASGFGCRYAALYYTLQNSSQLAKNFFKLWAGVFCGARTFACSVGTRADVVAQAFLPVSWRVDSLPDLVAAMLLGGAANHGCSRLSRRLFVPRQWGSNILSSGSIREC